MNRIACLLLLLLVGSPAVAGDDCLRFDRDGVELTGLVYLKTFYGPPNYGEDPDTDSLETQAFLALDTPICVYASDTGTEVGVSDVVDVTLVPLGKFGFTKVAGRRISVTGSLFSPTTAHHRTDVLLTVNTTPKVLR